MSVQPAAQTTPIEQAPPLVPITVIAHLLQNTLGALGLTAICISVALAAGVEFSSYRWSGIVGLGWWGLINWWRFSEEGRAAIRADYWKRMYEATDKEADALDALLHERDRTIAHQQAQLTARRNFVGAQPDSLSPTMNDARRMVQWKYGDGLDVTQRWAQREKAWNVNRYAAALNLLKGAQIVTMRGTQPEWAQYTSPAQALHALDDLSLVELMIESSESNSGEGGS